MIASPSPSQELAGDLLAALDPVVFAKRAGIAPDPWQAAVLRSPASQQLLLCSRQAGKSTISAVLAVHRAVFGDDRTVLLLSPSLRQSLELFRKSMQVYVDAGEPIGAVVENKLTLELRNGSRIVSLPGSEQTVRGFSSVDTLVVDEAALVDDKLYLAIRPMLAVSQGRLLALSTPRGKRGWFFRAWAEGGSEWHRTLVKATDIPHRIPPDWLEAERRNMPRADFEQEFMAVFGEMEDAVFSHDDIVAMRDDTITPLFAGGLLEGFSDASH